MLNKILRWLLYWPFRFTTTCEPIPYEPLKHMKLDPNLPICYVTVSSSIGNMMCLERLTNHLGLPNPFSKLYVQGQWAVRTAYLDSPRMFSSHSKEGNLNEAIAQWFQISATTSLPIQIIPLTPLWSRNPGYEGQKLHGFSTDNHTPSWRKFLQLTFQGRDNCVMVSNPVLTTDLVRDLGDHFKPELLRRLVSLHFIKNARTLVGRPLPNRERLIEELLRRPATQAAAQKEAEEKNKPLTEVQNEARQIFEIMVSDPRYPLLKFLNGIITRVWKRIYHGQTIKGAEKVVDLVQRGHEIIYIPCHRSHMDYVLLSFVIFHEGLPLPQIASGDNLNFFPVGPLIRRCGSYFIRRKMKGDHFYIALFSEYLSLLFERGYATEFFIEGGRSRTGRTLPPKTGMVSMAVQAQLRGISRPITFVPTYLGYEHVSEIRSYMSELSGVAKKKESAWQLLGIFKRMRYYGRGYVTFGQPVDITEFLDNNVPLWRKDIDPQGLTRPEWLRETSNALAGKIIRSLNGAASVNGINLCAMALMCDDDHTMSMHKLRSCLELFIKMLKVDPKLRDLVPEEDIDTLIKQALELNKFRAYDVGEDMKFLRPSYGQSLQLTYFKNNIVHLFALPALLANIILRNGHIKRSDIRVHARSLFYFLRHELYAPVAEADLDELIEKYIDEMLRGEYIVEHEGTIYVSGDGYEEFYILAVSVRPNLIRYLVAATALKNTPDNTIDQADFIEKCLVYAKRLPANVTDNSPEFADPILFRIMCETLKRHEYFFENANHTIHTNATKVQKLFRVTEPLLKATDVKTLSGKT